MSAKVIPPDPVHLTPAQRSFLEALERWEDDPEKEPPGIREFARELHVSHTQIMRFVDALAPLGWIEVAAAGRARRLVARHYVSGLPTRRDRKGAPRAALVTLTVEGRIAAGKPILAVKAGEHIVDVPSSWVGKGECYALLVQGDSMKEDAILSGDWIICRRTPSVDQGAKAVCLLPDGTATLKRVYREKGRVRLQPANGDYAPIVVDEVEIQGAVVAVLRLE